MHRPLGRAPWLLYGPVRLRWGSGSLVGRLGRRPCCLCKGYASASSCLAHFGGGKMRQTPCVLFLAKIVNRKVLFILRRRPKIFKRCLIFARSSPPPVCSLIWSCRRGSRIFLGNRGGWLYPTHPAVTVGRLQPLRGFRCALCVSASP